MKRKLKQQNPFGRCYECFKAIYRIFKSCRFPNSNEIFTKFRIYVHYVPDGNFNRKDEIIAIPRNLQIHFEQFSNETEESIRSMKTPIENKKKLREPVKIE